MKSTITLILMVAFGSAFAQKDPLAEARKAIEQSNAIYFDSFRNNDASIFIARYAKDACILAPDSPIACGSEAVASFFKGAYEDYGLRGGKFITTAVYGDGKDFVTEEGLWQSFDASGKLFDDGKFLVLWKKTPEGWKMFRDSFSSNKSSQTGK
ncbi:MAG TPA: nuclear transport factor 2 family protein [Cyclobacteriaceae bacterium]